MILTVDNKRAGRKYIEDIWFLLEQTTLSGEYKWARLIWITGLLNIFNNSARC